MHASNLNSNTRRINVQARSLAAASTITLRIASHRPLGHSLWNLLLLPDINTISSLPYRKDWNGKFDLHLHILYKRNGHSILAIQFHVSD